MKISELKKAAKQGIVVRLTFDGAFQRAKIYNNKAHPIQKKEFRIYIANLLKKYLIKIQERKRYSDSDHYKTIEAFATEVSGKYKGILKKKNSELGLRKSSSIYTGKFVGYLQMMFPNQFTVRLIQLL